MPAFHEYICFQVGIAARVLQKYYNAKYSDYGLTLAQSFILLALYEKDGLGVKGLAEYLFLDSSAVTGLIDRMEKEDLLKRRVDPEDRRAFQISLTQKGRNLAEQILPISKDLNESMKLALNKEEWNGLMSFVKKIQEYCK
ncbi:MarR family transcriptional regulator [Desulfallas sp. Bu1-1]|uniref:MarR family winged helix-turn-helix transcriptional regulator n=1 Tax=Desulfallas sp. Bu1-1 TaxID=2787620 RepID=UPI00189D3B6F|nr:MarR family transcriptional regulator [Desulfallas sp. Bu1-1]MBF7084185.1 MarR family transcriptional regulator [Desulfallas sp. Bu1-1]